LPDKGFYRLFVVLVFEAEDEKLHNIPRDACTIHDRVLQKGRAEDSIIQESPRMPAAKTHQKGITVSVDWTTGYGKRGILA
jgi:hypothetical protein